MAGLKSRIDSGAGIELESGFEYIKKICLVGTKLLYLQNEPQEIWIGIP